MARNSSANLRSDAWPPGFRFHPTDEELVLYYLKRKICRRKIKLDIVAEVDVYKWDPEELPGLSVLKIGDRQWFFFSPRDRNYPNGSRANRATRHGYWKATGKDRMISCSSRNVGNKKTLVFYKGRAPHGERTDWVMHEYTMDEDELKRCQNVHDYYAIYKVFKKSGPGPKNGEQYGAPFREEDWVDDDFLETTSKDDQVNFMPQENNVSMEYSCGTARADASVNAVDEPVNHIVDEPVPQPVNIDEFEQALSQAGCSVPEANPSVRNFDEMVHPVVDEPVPQVDDFEQALCQFLGEELSQNATDFASSGEVISEVQCLTHPLSKQESNLEASFDAGQLASSGSSDLLEVTSGSNSFEIQQDLVADDDYLEMDDLLGPEPVLGADDHLLPPATGDNLPGTSWLGGVDGSIDFDLYYDADAFLRELPPIDQAVAPEPSSNSRDCALENQASSQWQHYPEAVGSFWNDPWSYDANTYFPDIRQPSQGSVPLSTTGVVQLGSSASMATDLNQNRSGKEAEGTQSWISSSLWSFVESIPAAPASAAESALVVNTFHRMSSFSRLRMNAKSTIVAAGGASRPRPRPASAAGGGRFKGFFLFSSLVALFAVIYVFIASTASVFGKLHCHMKL